MFSLYFRFTRSFIACYFCAWVHVSFHCVQMGITFYHLTRCLCAYLSFCFRHNLILASMLTVFLLYSSGSSQICSSCSLPSRCSSSFSAAREFTDTLSLLSWKFRTKNVTFKLFLGTNPPASQRWRCSNDISCSFKHRGRVRLINTFVPFWVLVLLLFHLSSSPSWVADACGTEADCMCSYLHTRLQPPSINPLWRRGDLSTFREGRRHLLLCFYTSLPSRQVHEWGISSAGMYHTYSSALSQHTSCSLQTARPSYYMAAAALLHPQEERIVRSCSSVQEESWLWGSLLTGSMWAKCRQTCRCFLLSFQHMIFPLLIEKFSSFA